MVKTIEELFPGEIAQLDVELDELIATYGPRAFSEMALSGLAKDRGGLLIQRQIERNEVARRKLEGGQDV